MAWRKREDKERFVKDFGEDLKKKKDFILAEYRGLNAAEMTEIRKKVREGGFKFIVAKNTLMRLLMKEHKLDGVDELLNGPNAVIAGGEELNEGAKILDEFAKEHEALKLKGGYLGDSALSAAQVKSLATLPSKDTLRGILAGVLNGPIRALATSLNGIVRGLATALDAVAKQKEEKK